MRLLDCTVVLFLVFLRNLLIPHNGCTNLYPHQQWIRIPCPLHALIFYANVLIKKYSLPCSVNIPIAINHNSTKTQGNLYRNRPLSIHTLQRSQGPLEYPLQYPAFLLVGPAGMTYGSLFLIPLLPLFLHVPYCVFTSVLNVDYCSRTFQSLLLQSLISQIFCCKIYLKS